ncbi:MAG: hypothetical protein RSD36_14435 [Terrisporobacter sp.]
MKKLLGLMLLMSLPLILFTAYSKHEYLNSSVSSAQETPTKDDVYIDMQIQKYGYKSNLGEEIFEIPLFVSKTGDNKEINKLNDSIAPLLNYYNGNYGFKQDEDTCEVKSYPFTSDNYLQVITTATIYPNSNSQGEIFSYNYDIKNEKILTLQDAYKKDKKTETQVINEIKTSFNKRRSNKKIKLLKIEVNCFLIDEDNIKYFIKINISNPKSKDINIICTYNSHESSLEEYDGICLINPKQPDKFEPYLCYERNDIKEKYYTKKESNYIK